MTYYTKSLENGPYHSLLLRWHSYTHFLDLTKIFNKTLYTLPHPPYAANRAYVN